MTREGRNDQVWIMRADGSHQHRLVHEPAWSGNGPSFTAGGHRVLYSRCGNYVAFYFTCKIVSVRLDGSGLRTIIGGTWHPYDPVMSPDGSKIAYVSDAGGIEGRVWLADADGTNRSVIGPDVHRAALLGARRQPADVHRRATGTGPCSRWTPTARPDGDPARLAVLRVVAGRRLDRVACRKVRTATARCGSRGPMGAIPWRSWTPTSASVSWIGGSPDEARHGGARSGVARLVAGRSGRRGRRAARTLPANGRILFTHCDDASGCQIYTANPDGSAIEQVTHAAGEAVQGDWSPDGERITYVSFTSGDAAIWIINADGSHPQQLTPNDPDSDNFWPRFTPDGVWILFTNCFTDDCDGGISMIKTDGSAMQP